jgi:hypothetical protein
MLLSDDRFCFCVRTTIRCSADARAELRFESGLPRKIAHFGLRTVWIRLTLARKIPQRL